MKSNIKGEFYFSKKIKGTSLLEYIELPKSMEKRNAKVGFILQVPEVNLKMDNTGFYPVINANIIFDDEGKLDFKIDTND